MNGLISSQYRPFVKIYFANTFQMISFNPTHLCQMREGLFPVKV